MIAVDSSAILAIILEEPDAATFATQLHADDDPRITVASVLECLIVLRGKSGITAGQLDGWFDGFARDANLTFEPVSLKQFQVARVAYLQYGKGTGHGAALNFGDCFSYALAKSLNAPLLYKGNDFAKTDIVSAV